MEPLVFGDALYLKQLAECLANLVVVELGRGFDERGGIVRRR